MLSERRPPTANSRISAFLESQRGLMSHYAAEGKSVAATWPKQSSGDSRPASPMLVSRAAAAKDNEPLTMALSVPPDQPAPTFPIGKEETSMLELQTPRPACSSKPTRVVPVPLKASQRKSTDRDQYSDDEPDRLQRLEQRRNRRRARRYAMEVAEGATNRGDKASENDISRMTKSRQKSQSTDKTNKKKGKVKVTPALLLMQNFSSQSLGKSRLTMRPSPTVGVFNKGKNSGKITKSGRTERLVPDIVFSESRFLNKTLSARNGDEDIEDDSDYSDDHSAHSLEEHVRRRKDRAIKSSQRSSDKVDLNQSSRLGSPVPSSPPAREDSPPWNIEETIPLSPSSSKSASRPSNEHSTSPSAQKDITVNTERSVWASKLRDPGSHIPKMLDNANSASGSHLTRVLPAQHQTTSAYFAPIATSRETQPSAAPSIEVDRLEDKQPRHQVDSCSIAIPDMADSPSTPECLQLEHARLLSASGDTYMRALDVTLHLNGASTLQPLSPATNLQAADIHREWDYEVAPQSEREVQNQFTVGRTKRMGWANEHTWNDSDILGWEEYPRSRNAFPMEEAQFHEAHSDLDYDVPFEDRVEYSNATEYLYEDSERVYEDDEYLDTDMGTYALYQGDGDLEYDDFDEEAPLEGSNYNLHMEVMQEQEPYQSVEWPTVDDTVEDLAPDQTDPELDEMFQDEWIETDDEWAEQTPRLIRVITEASLQDDLIKSMSGHWSVAHRLY
ncbi:unnamed protein product [Rhizoctonia solani]|uniref:Uncharacterized protein n=1 Tax=Rhizoctonia solani TaxID=456999 RepID=A0A8H2XT49_9AGAM|nr:unnamed protein product [Rhizoctonia solani]